MRRLARGAPVVRAVALTLALGLAAAACAHVPPQALGVPAVQQETDYSCGPAALLAVLRYWNAFGGCERDLYAPLATSDKDGTEPWALERVARARGLSAQYRIGVTVDELRGALAAGQTVILDLQAWRDDARDWSSDWDDGHYVVLIAIEGRRLYAMDPSADAGYAWLDLDEFVTRWHDYVKEGDRVVRLQHMAVFIAGATHGYARPRRLEKLR